MNDRLLGNWPNFDQIEIPLNDIAQQLGANSKEQASLELIESIIWFKKLDESSLKRINITSLDESIAHDNTEINILVVKLHAQQIPYEFLALVDKSNDKFFIFLCYYQGRYCLLAHHKKPILGQDQSNLTNTVNSSWLTAEQIKLDIQGSSISQAYLNCLEQIYHGPTTISSEHEVSIEELLRNEARLTELQQQLSKCQKQKRKERQPNKKYQLHSQEQQLTKQISKIESFLSQHKHARS